MTTATNLRKGGQLIPRAELRRPVEGVGGDNSLIRISNDLIRAYGENNTLGDNSSWRSNLDVEEDRRINKIQLGVQIQIDSYFAHHFFIVFLITKLLTCLFSFAGFLLELFPELF